LRETGVRDVIFFDNAARCFSSLDPTLSPRTSVLVHGTELRVPSRVGEWLSGRFELERRALLSASLIWAVSEATADMVRELEPQLNVGVIHPCSEKAASAGDPRPPCPEEFRDAPLETLKLLTVGRLVERKGHETVLRMLARLEHELPPFVYVVVGSGSWEARLRALARTLGLEQRVRFTGRVPGEALAGYYAHADLFVMLPHEASDGVEGFGLVYVEAGAFGVPSVASNHCGAREAVLDGVTGITLQSEPSRQDDVRFLRLARDGDLRRSLGEAARRRAADLSAPRFVDRLVEGHHGLD
jgi:phosphatidylinositol alpha-1,6-mannosyltransferase